MQRVFRSIVSGLLLGTPLLNALGSDPIGASALRQCDSTLGGRGVAVAQVEASAPGWQANPGVLGQSPKPFAWICAQGAATNFPNSIGSESAHADAVAGMFFGVSAGVAPGVSAIDNYEASFFMSDVIASEQPIEARIVNQSFTSFTRSVAIDQTYDNYAARYNVLFVSGAGNTGRPKSPGTAFNGICVGAYGGTSSIGPITDGRSKPDITAPAAYTSFSAPLVSGAAAILLQAAQRDYGTPEATDIRTLKALLLNGATKPAGWTNSPASPLDARYGAGIVNAFNSYRQLRGGKVFDRIAATNRCGWDFASITNGTNDYWFQISGTGSYSFAATLVWLRNYGQTNISNLDLLLFDANGSVIASSQSQMDNVEHIFIPFVWAGTFHLRIVQASSAAASETYGLAFEFLSFQPPELLPLSIRDAGCEGLLAGEANQRYLIQGTTDFRSWIPLCTNTAAADGILKFGTPCSLRSACFFRALVFP